MKPSERQKLCAKPSLSQVRTVFQVAGVHGNGDDARAALSLLASLKDRIEALRALLPNLARTIDFLLMAGSVAVRRPNDSGVSLSREAPPKQIWGGESCGMAVAQPLTTRANLCRACRLVGHTRGPLAALICIAQFWRSDTVHARSLEIT